jgi:hypothetical protein
LNSTKSKLDSKIRISDVCTKLRIFPDPKVNIDAAVTLLVGRVAVGWGELHIYPGVLQMTDKPQYLNQA